MTEKILVYVLIRSAQTRLFYFTLKVPATQINIGMRKWFQNTVYYILIELIISAFKTVSIIQGYLIDDINDINE